MRVEIDTGNDEGADGGRRQIDNANTARTEKRGVVAVRAGACRVEGKCDVSGFRHGEEILQPGVANRDAEPPRPCKALRIRVDADHGADLQRR